MKKKTKNIIILSSVILLILAIGYFGTKQNFFGCSGKYVYAGTTTRSACYPESPFYGEIGEGYKTKINVALCDMNLNDDNTFVWDIGLRTTSEFYGSANDGLPAQVLCDGSYDCNYGYTTEEWELMGDKCYLVQSEEENIVEIPEEIIEEIEIPEKPDDNVVENPDNPEELVVECTSNIECLDECGNKIPTCVQGFCECDGTRYTIEYEKPNYFYYLIPFTIIILVALIIWARRKKPKRRKK